MRCICQIFYLGTEMMKIHLMRLYQLLLSCKIWKLQSFLIIYSVSKIKADALPEQDKLCTISWIWLHVYFLSWQTWWYDITSLNSIAAEYTKNWITPCVYKEEKRHLHDILNVMTRSMTKSRKAAVPAIYPFKRWT